MNPRYVFKRLIHTSYQLEAAFNKNDLAKLRKKTGYTFTNCKKALEENDNDIVRAEKWLKEQAQALGWSKAIKLGGRSTLQGLIGVTSSDHSSLMIEVNCETDFVARNKVFTSFVETSTETCLNQFKDHPENVSLLDKINFTSKELSAITAQDGKSLADHSALAISKVGENINLRRAIYVKSPKNIYLSCYTHPAPEKISSKIYTGKYGALIAYMSETNDSTVQQVARQLCQHIIGMNPTKIGKSDEDEPLGNPDDENIMIHQEFLLDPSMTVGQLINDVNINIVDFVRFECGETPEEAVVPPIESEQVMRS